MFAGQREMCIHPQTRLRENAVGHPNSINCNACECTISDTTSFKCGACNSNLHPLCKSLPHTLSSAAHPHSLFFLSGLISRVIRPHCDGCGDHIRGVSYACFACDFHVHPNCSQLPRRIPPSRPRRQVQDYFNNNIIGGPHYSNYFGNYGFLNQQAFHDPLQMYTNYLAGGFTGGGGGGSSTGGLVGQLLGDAAGNVDSGSLIDMVSGGLFQSGFFFG